MQWFNSMFTEIHDVVIIQTHRCLVCPAMSYVYWCVSPTTQHKHRDVEGLDKLDAPSVSTDRNVKASHSVTSERVSATLQHDCIGFVEVNDIPNNWLENMLVHVIINTLLERYVDGLVATGVDSEFINVARAREEIIILLV